jgi:hypothetical protein
MSHPTPDELFEIVTSYLAAIEREAAPALRLAAAR